MECVWKNKHTYINMEESVWSAVWQKNESQDQGKGIQEDSKISSGVRSGDMSGEEGAEKKKVVEMKMLRWMCVVTALDKIRNEKIRGSTKVGEISKKVEERGMWWYVHVTRRDTAGYQIA